MIRYDGHLHESRPANGTRLIHRSTELPLSFIFDPSLVEAS